MDLFRNFWTLKEDYDAKTDESKSNQKVVVNYLRGKVLAYC